MFRCILNRLLHYLLTCILFSYIFVLIRTMIFISSRANASACHVLWNVDRRQDVPHEELHYIVDDAAALTGIAAGHKWRRLRPEFEGDGVGAPTKFFWRPPNYEIWRGRQGTHSWN